VLQEISTEGSQPPERIRDAIQELTAARQRSGHSHGYPR
jgi:hypothetical protein